MSHFWCKKVGDIILLSAWFEAKTFHCYIVLKTRKTFILTIFHEFKTQDRNGYWIFLLASNASRYFHIRGIRINRFEGLRHWLNSPQIHLFLFNTCLISTTFVKEFCFRKSRLLLITNHSALLSANDIA